MRGRTPDLIRRTTGLRLPPAALALTASNNEIQRRNRPRLDWWGYRYEKMLQRGLIEGRLAPLLNSRQHYFRFNAFLLYPGQKFRFFSVTRH